MILCLIIPTYNRADYLLQALHSCEAQKLAPGQTLCVIIIDDGSTDDTEQKIQSHLGPNVFYQRIENSERGRARNIGAEIALQHFQADWLLFLDADDVLVPGALTTVIARMDPQALLVSAKYVLWNEKDTYGQACPPGLPRPSPVADLFLFSNPLALGTTFIKADLFKQTNGFSIRRELSGSEDWLLLFELSTLAPVQFIDVILVWYRQHGSNTAPEKTQKALKLCQQEIDPLFEKHYGRRAGWAKKRLKVHFELITIGAFNSNGRQETAWTLLVSFLKQYPGEFFHLRTLRVIVSVLYKKIKY